MDKILTLNLINKKELIETKKALKYFNLSIISTYEKKYGFTSEKMQEEVNAGRLYPDYEIHQWLMDKQLRDRMIEVIKTFETTVKDLKKKPRNKQ